MEEKKKHIDELFKAGLTDPGIPFDEANWEAMEQKLNANKTRKLTLIWYSAIGTAAAVILAVSALLWFPDRQSRPAQQISQHPPHPAAEGNTPKTQEKLAETEKPFPTKGTSTSTKLSSWRPNKPLANDTFTNTEFALRLPLNGTVERETLISRAIPHLPAKLQSSFELAQTATALSPARTLPEEKRKPSIVRSAINRTPILSVLAAPDLTNVQGAGNPQFSPNIGLLVTVPLTRKWSISSGLLYAKKNYNSPFSFYKPNSNYVWAERPEQVNANCDVLDVPIDLNYELLSKQRTSIKISGGLSSYFMLREQYHFIYNSAEAYETNLPTSFEVRGRNQHLLGVGNLAVSVEQQLNSKMSIGVRPFIKLPLTDIGWGQSKLQSTGVAVSVNFHLGKK